MVLIDRWDEIKWKCASLFYESIIKIIKHYYKSNLHSFRTHFYVNYISYFDEFIIQYYIHEEPTYKPDVGDD